jgi:hypothetical protein
MPAQKNGAGEGVLCWLASAKGRACAVLDDRMDAGMIRAHELQHMTAWEVCNAGGFDRIVSDGLKPIRTLNAHGRTDSGVRFPQHRSQHSSCLAGYLPTCGLVILLPFHWTRKHHAIRMNFDGRFLTFVLKPPFFQPPASASRWFSSVPVVQWIERGFLSSQAQKALFYRGKTS